MPETKVRSPDGQIITVRHPEGASESEIIAYAKQNATSQRASTLAANPTEYDPNSPEFQQKYGPASTVNVPRLPQSELQGMDAQQLAGYYKNLPSQPAGAQLQGLAEGLGKFWTDLGLGAKQLFGFAPGSAATDKRALDAPLMATDVGKVGYVGGGGLSTLPLSAIPGANTIAGSALIGGGMGALQPAESGGQRALNTGVGATAGAVMQYLGNKVGGVFADTGGKKAPPEPTLDLGGTSPEAVGDKLVTKVFDNYKAKVGPATVVPASNTKAAINDAISQMAAAGRKSKELERIVAGSPTGEMTVDTLDDIFRNMTGHMVNPRAVPAKQAKSILDAITADLDGAGQSVGFDFADNLTSARALTSLYRSDNLGKVVGQYGPALDALKGSNPDLYQEIAQDWSAKQIQKFIQVNPAGGREINTRALADWTTKNAPHIERIVGPETLKVWQDFPAWQARNTAMLGLVKSAVKTKIGPLFGLFDKSIDRKFAEGMAQMITDPASPVYQTILASAKTTVPPVTFPVQAGLPTLNLGMQQLETNGQNPRP